MNYHAPVSVAGVSLVAFLTFAPGLLGATTGVVKTGGDTDRLSAKYSGQIFDISNPTGTVLVAGHKVPTFGDDLKAFVDPVHEWNAASATVTLPSYWVGGQYVMSANNNRDNASLSLAISVPVQSYIYLLIDNRRNDGNAAIPRIWDPAPAEWSGSVSPMAGAWWPPERTGPET